RTVQRRQVDQPFARSRRCRAVSELPHARRTCESRRTPDHDVVQRDSNRPRFLGLRDLVQRLGPGSSVRQGLGPATVAGVPVAPQSQVARVRAALGLMVASGFAGLGYQIVWTQESALWLGHEAAAVLAVIAAFFGGLALGAVLLGTRI